MEGRQGLTARDGRFGALDDDVDDVRDGECAAFGARGGAGARELCGITGRE